MKRTTISFNMKGLDKFTEGVDKYRARVGVLGQHAVRDDTGEGINNALLLLIHMFGSITRNIPPRDPLIIPIETHKKEIINGLKKGTVRTAIIAGDFKKMYALLGALAENYVQEAFETGGFGQWPALMPATIARKKSDQPLIDSGQLRRAITSDVVNKSEAV